MLTTISGLGHALAMTVTHSEQRDALSFAIPMNGAQFAAPMYRACVKSMIDDPPPWYLFQPFAIFRAYASDDGRCEFWQLYRARKVSRESHLVCRRGSRRSGHRARNRDAGSASSVRKRAKIRIASMRNNCSARASICSAPSATTSRWRRWTTQRGTGTRRGARTVVHEQGRQAVGTGVRRTVGRTHGGDVCRLSHCEGFR